MIKTYFTFGTDSQFPFSQDDYVVIEAEDMNQACDIFNLIHPPRRGGSNICNCAFIYSEEQFDSFRDKWYRGVEPVEVVSIRRRDEG